MLKYPYFSIMRPNLAESFAVGWMACNPDAENLPFATMFGSSRFDSPDKLSCHDLGELYELHPPFNAGILPGWLKGQHTCGSASDWSDGWAPGTPGLPFGPDGVPVCCGQAPAAFDFGFDLGFDS